MAVDDWETHYTETGEAYYYNIRTDESTWYDFSSLSIPRVRAGKTNLCSIETGQHDLLKSF